MPRFHTRSSAHVSWVSARSRSCSAGLFAAGRPAIGVVDCPRLHRSRGTRGPVRGSAHAMQIDARYPRQLVELVADEPYRQATGMCQYSAAAPMAASQSVTSLSAVTTMMISSRP